MNEDNTTTYTILVTDVGNGCSICDNCELNLDNGDASKVIPENCPKCGKKFVGSSTWVNHGGDDF